MDKPSFKILEMAINALQEQERKEDKWQKTFNDMFDGNFIPTYSYILYNTIINMLREVFKDKYDWIPYWIFEGNFGKKARIWEKVNGKEVEISVKTVKEFYDFLIQEYFSEEEIEELKEPNFYDYSHITNVPIKEKKEYNPADEFFKITC